jgi:hypothetical protein
VGRVKHGRRDMGGEVKVKIMSNDLVRWKSPANRRKIEAAVALARQRGAGPAPAPAAGQVVDVERVCAVHDKPFIASYVRGADGPLRFTKSFKVKAEAGGNGSASGTSLQSIPPREFSHEGPGEICAWCGAGPGFLSGRRFSAVACSQCGGAVCVGRTEDRFFRCRASCGGAGWLGDEAVESKGSTRKEANPRPTGPSGSAGAPDRSAGAAVQTDRRLLSSGNPGQFDMLRPDGKR